jgi:hypothetical protein
MDNYEDESSFDFGGVGIVIGASLFFGLMASNFVEGRFTVELLLVGACFGAFIGFAGLSAVDEKKWKPRPWLCAFLGAIGAVIYAHYVQSPIWGLPIAALVGAMLGFFAPKWVMYIR